MRSFIILNAAALMWGGWRRRYLIAVPILIVPILALVIGVISPKKFTSYTTILVQEAAKQNPFLEDLAVPTNLKSRMEALKALLHSRHVLAAVAVKQGLISKETPEEDREKVIAKLSKSLKAKLVGDDLIKIVLESDKPEGMRDFLWAVTLHFMKRVVAPQRSSITKSEAFLATEIEKRKKELVAAENNRADYKRKFAGELPTAHPSNVNRLATVRQAIADRRIALEGAIAARDSLKKRLAQTDPVVGRIEEAIVQGLSELAVLRGRYTDSHTKVQAAIRKLNSLQSERVKALRAIREITAEGMERLWNRASSQATAFDAKTQPLLISQLQKLQEADSRVSTLREEMDSLSLELSELERVVAAASVHEQRLIEIEREISVKKKMYDELAQRHQKAQVTGALERSEESERVKIIDPPFTPANPTNPSIIIFLVAGIIGGVSLGIGLALVAELLDTTLWRRDSLSTLVGVPVLTRLPVLPNEGFRVNSNALDLPLITPPAPPGAVSHP